MISDPNYPLLQFSHSMNCWWPQTLWCAWPHLPWVGEKVEKNCPKFGLYFHKIWLKTKLFSLKKHFLLGIFEKSRFSTIFYGNINQSLGTFFLPFHQLKGGVLADWVGTHRHFTQNGFRACALLHWSNIISLKNRVIDLMLRTNISSSLCKRKFQHEFSVRFLKKASTHTSLLIKYVWYLWKIV